MTRKKLYNLNNEPHFESPENDCLGLPFILERDFSEDELKYPKFNSGKTDIVVDTVKLDEDLSKIENQRIDDINNKAGEIILASYPDYKQRNMIARYNELLEILVNGQNHSTSEATEFQDLKDVWDWVKSVRQTSNDAITNGTLLKDIVWP